MRRGVFFISIFLLFCYYASISIAQTPIMDSLRKALTLPVQNDTMRVFQYTELGWYMFDFDIDKAEVYQQKALQLSKRIGHDNGICDALNLKGIVQRIKGNYASAIQTFTELEKRRISLGQDRRLIGVYGNLANVYLDKGDRILAINNVEKAIAIAKRFNDFKNQVTLLTNLGIMYQEQGLANKAADCFLEGISINKKVRDVDLEISLNVNIGVLYFSQNFFEKSIETSLYALSLIKKSPNIRNEATLLNNLMSCYIIENQITKATFHLKRMKKIAYELADSSLIFNAFKLEASCLIHLNQPEVALKTLNSALKYIDTLNDSNDFFEYEMKVSLANLKLKQYKKALIHGKIALNLAISRKLKHDVFSAAYANLYDVFIAMGDFKNANFYLNKKFDAIEKNRITTTESQIATLNALNHLDIKMRDIELLKKQKEKMDLENQQKNIALAGGTIAGVLLLGLLVMSFRANRSKRKANLMLFQQNEEISNQKEIIEVKQKEIVDSIHYAKRIQNALLASELAIKNQVKDFFIYFQPKDIVSGDFYWCAEQGNRFYIAICDSTGHGVPGAFMSLLNITYLNEAINEKQLVSPAAILDFVRARLVQNISQDGAQDGMDGILFCFEKSSQKLTFSAAYNSPICITNGVSTTHQTNKMPIGLSDKQQGFVEYEIVLEPDSIVYAYTDGYADQFGGEKGKKFKQGRLIELLEKISSKSMIQQENEIKNEFENWKGSNEQVDDVALIGLKFF